MTAAHQILPENYCLVSPKIKIKHFLGTIMCTFFCPSWRHIDRSLHVGGMGVNLIFKKGFFYYFSSFLNIKKPPWRNWLARSAVNRKVGGSSPPGGEVFFPFRISVWYVYVYCIHTLYVGCLHLKAVSLSQSVALFTTKKISFSHFKDAGKGRPCLSGNFKWPPNSIMSTEGKISLLYSAYTLTQPVTKPSLSPHPLHLFILTLHCIMYIFLLTLSYFFLLTLYTYIYLHPHISLFLHPLSICFCFHLSSFSPSIYLLNHPLYLFLLALTTVSLHFHLLYSHSLYYPSLSLSSISPFLNTLFHSPSLPPHPV